MLPIQSVTLSVSPGSSSERSYFGDSMVLASAHASPRGIQFCFDSRPRALPAPRAERAMAWSLPRQLTQSSERHRWAVVLAGGSGKRLASLAAIANGAAIPKQYCSLLGGRSLLGDALTRAERLVSSDRVVTVVASEHEKYWRRELHEREPGSTIVQPQNRGTGAGVLLPLLAILARDPLAQVTLLPSDHFAADEPSLARALRDAQAAADMAPDRVLVVGVEPEGPEPDYGWILPGAARRGTYAVRRFVEKPDPLAAAELMTAGAVWNSFLIVGSARAFLRLYERRLPSVLDAFVAANGSADPEGTARLYATLPEADFCRDVLAGSEEWLGLRVAPACGWTDLGTPTRVAQCAAWLREHGCATPSEGSLGAGVLASTWASRRDGLGISRVYAPS